MTQVDNRKSSMEDILKEILTNKRVQLNQSKALFESLQESNDLDIQRYILGILKKHLNQKEIFELWCPLIFEKWAKPLRYEVVIGLNDAIGKNTLCRDWHKLLLAKFDKLLRIAKEESFGEELLFLIINVVLATPSANELVKLLVHTKEQRVREIIVQQLFAIRRQWEKSPVFFAGLLKNRADTIPSALRPQVIAFLIEKEQLAMADQIRLLKLSEDVDTRYAILLNWNNRFEKRNKSATELLVKLLQTEPSDKVRTMAASLLMKFLPANPSLIPPFVEAFKTATKPELQHLLQSYLAISIGSPAHSDILIGELLDGIIKASKVEVALRCVSILEPLLSEPGETGEKVFQGFCSALEHQLHTDLYRRILSALRLVAVSRPNLSSLLIHAFDNITNDIIKAELIILLAELPDLSPEIEERLRKEAKAALYSTQGVLRGAGLYYLLSLPLSQETQEIMTSGIHLLNDTAIAQDIRSEYGYKLSKVITMTPQSLQNLEEVLKGMGEVHNFRNPKGALRKLADRIRNTAINEREPDWDDFLNRIQNNKALDGISPAVYLHYDKNPAKAKVVLKAMLLQPAFYYHKLAEKEDVLNFLLAHNQIDKEVAAFAFDQLIFSDYQDQRLNYYLMILKNYSELGKDTDRLWLVFERKNNPRYLNPTLLREVFIHGFGTPAELCKQMKSQLLGKKSSLSLEPYLHFLKNNPRWENAREVLVFFEDIIEATPQLGENGIRDRVNQLRLDMGLDTLRPGLKAQKVKKGGLLDD